MPFYSVRATQVVRDLLKTRFEIEADNEDHARALAEARLIEDAVSWDFAEVIDAEPAEIDEIERLDVVTVDEPAAPPAKRGG